MTTHRVKDPTALLMSAYLLLTYKAHDADGKPTRFPKNANDDHVVRDIRLFLREHGKEV